MSTRAKAMRGCLIAVLAGNLAPLFGTCTTTNQLKDFIRTEIAVVSTQIITEPINDSLFALTGPQVVEEVVPSLEVP